MKPKVLFVDDEPHVIQAITRALRKEPFKLLCAGSAQEALDLLEKETVDVIVSDERMPGMSGSEFLSIACKEYPDTMRIMLTGHASLDAAVRAINEGEVFRFLVKPCNPVELSVTIQQALKQRELLDESQRLLNTSRRQSAIIDDMEDLSPDITEVKKDEQGTIILDDVDCDMDELVRQMNNQVKKGEDQLNKSRS